MQWQQDGITVVNDKNVINLDVVYALLQQSYWANTRTKETIAKTIEHSLCFSVFKEDTQIGFARVVTDYAAFAWVGDVIVAPRFRRQGIGKFLMKCITEHPAIQTTKQLLTTKDAHGLYEQFRFEKQECMIRAPDHK